MSKVTKMLFVGDISLGGEYASQNQADSLKWTKPFLDLKPVFDEADICIGNLESPLFLSSTPECKRNSLSTSPNAIEALNFMNFSAINLANNHITDQGAEGITRTCDLLEAREISHFGAGMNLDAALRPAFVCVKDVTFAFLGYVEETPEVGAQSATESQPGCTPLSLERIARDIATIRDKASHIVVSLHWGYQFDHFPEPQQMELARKIIDLGALVVHGHHPHVVQGMERYRNGLILYSLGNFFFPNFKRTDGCWFRFPKESRRTAAVQCEVGTDGVLSVSQVPLMIDPNYRIRVLKGKSAAQAIAELNLRSSLINAVEYRDLWSKHHKKTKAKRERKEIALIICGGMNKVIRRIRKDGLAAFFMQLRIYHFIALFHKFRDFYRQKHS